MQRKGSTSGLRPREYKYLQRRTLLILYLTYGGFYLSRKADSVVKSSLHEIENFTVEDLAMLDTVYLFVYTFSLAFSGFVGGFIPSRKLLCTCLIGLAFTSFAKSRATTPSGFALCQVLHALFQSGGWPTCIKLIGTWVDENRGFVMGLWTTCQSLGGILGAIWATFFMTRYDWPMAYRYHIPILLLLAVVCSKYILEDPLDRSLDTTNVSSNGNGMSYKSLPSDEPASSRIEAQPAESSQSSGKRVPLMRILFLPGVISIGVSYFFLKFLRYALLMWLPYYYEEGLHFDQATSGYMSTSFEMGGLIGTPFIGFISDRQMKGKRDLTAAWFLLSAAIMLVNCVIVAHGGAWLNACSMFLVGILVIGPDSILSGTIAQDIGSKNSSMGKQIIGTLAGLINSMGSFGSIFQSFVIAKISTTFGWDILFVIFILCAVTSSGILFKVALSSEKGRPNLKQYFHIHKKRVALGAVCVFGLAFYSMRTSSPTPVY